MSESYNNESLFDFVDNHDKSVNNVPAEVASMPVTLLPAKLPLAGTFLFIRPIPHKHGFWVKFLRIETWCHTQSGVRQWVYVGEKARRRRVMCNMERKLVDVFTVPKQGETWTFTADTIVKPRLYTAVRHDRLLRVMPALAPLGGVRPLKEFCEAAGYTHVLGGYSAAKSLYPDVGIVRGEGGVGIASPF